MSEAALKILCAWCATYFDWTPPHKGAPLKRYCCRTHKDRANQASRRMKTHFTPGTCPTPSKRTYASEEAARAFVLTYPERTGGARIYLCSCGEWHVGRVKRGISAATTEQSA